MSIYTSDIIGQVIGEPEIRYTFNKGLTKPVLHFIVKVKEEKHQVVAMGNLCAEAQDKLQPGMYVSVYGTPRLTKGRYTLEKYILALKIKYDQPTGESV